MRRSSVSSSSGAKPDHSTGVELELTPGPRPAYVPEQDSDRAVRRRRGSGQPATSRVGSASVLNQVADGVWVRQSEWVWSNAIVVRGEGGLILVDPGINGSDLSQLADDVDGLGIPVAAGFSTHPHWDHLLWHSRFGDVPRYATPGGARAAGEARERAQPMAADSAPGIPLELIGLLTPLPADGGPVPGEIIEHQAHAIGHAAVLLADRGVLLAGDMLSDVLIPPLGPRRPLRRAPVRDAGRC